VVFGVATEYCVSFAARGLIERGRNVTLVKDAIETLNRQDGERTIAELAEMGARVTTTEEILGKLADTR
jgi:nicotinamidase-related amidase